MSDHIRSAIRAAAVSALTSLTTTGARVYAGRVYPLKSAHVPGLLVYTDREDSNSEGASSVLERQLDLVVEAYVKENDTFDATIDTIVKEVETALSAAGVNLGGGKYAHLRSVEIEREGEGDKPVGRARMTFEVMYCTAHGAPTVAL